MTRIKVSPEKIIIIGHSNYDDFGKDIVCASISSITTCTINAILSFDKNAINYNYNSGLVTIDILKKDETTKKLIDNMVNLFIELTNDYPKNIKVERE